MLRAMDRLAHRSLLPASLLALAAALSACGGGQPPPPVPPASVQPDLAPAVSDAGAVAPTPEADAGAVAVAPAHAVSFAYEGERGPEHWGDLAPEYATCKTGAAQSPIDLPIRVPKGKLSPIAFHYGAEPLRVVNNGHTLEVPTAPGGLAIVVGPSPSDRYELVGFHVHSPAEHTLRGQRFAMEMHLVHRNAEGKLAVVGVLFKKGKAHPALAPILAGAPTEPSDTPKEVAGATVDPSAFLPATKGYIRYDGSLTTPPCAEGVTWFVMTTPQEISEAQVHAIQERTDGPTNRPTQARAHTLMEYRP